MPLTNVKNLPMSVAVWLAHDTYDRVTSNDYISATGLLRPVKQIVLGSRVPPEKQLQDISELVPSRMGTAIHEAIEKAWIGSYRTGMANMGVQQHIIDRVRINPTAVDLVNDPTIIPIYMEQREIRNFMGYRIGGKFDFIIEDELEDFKSTKVYSYQAKSNDQDYIRQASIYRWLNQDKVKKETFKINYIFTDWLRSKVIQDPTYPRSQILQKTFHLMSIAETEAFMANKLQQVKRYENSPESDIPACSDEDLWRSPSAFKYYKNPAKTEKSTKNFDTMAEANGRLVEDGHVGIVKEVKGEVRRCNYCPAFSVCKQKDAYIANGLLTLLE